jgi:phage major head subunit gpT-like protein
LRKKRQFFRRKLAKIAENCDHNIDPRMASDFFQAKLSRRAGNGFNYFGLCQKDRKYLGADSLNTFWLQLYNLSQDGGKKYIVLRGIREFYCLLCCKILWIFFSNK